MFFRTVFRLLLCLVILSSPLSFALAVQPRVDNRELLEAIGSLCSCHSNSSIIGNCNCIFEFSAADDNKTRQTFEREFEIDFSRNGKQAKFELISVVDVAPEVRLKKGSLNTSKAVVFAEEFERLSVEGVQKLGNHIRVWPKADGVYFNQFERIGYSLGILEPNGMSLKEFVDPNGSEIGRIEGDVVVTRVGVGTIKFKVSAVPGETSRLLEYSFFKCENDHIHDALGSTAIKDRFIAKNEPYESMQVCVKYLQASGDKSTNQVEITETCVGSKGTRNKFSMRLKYSVKPSIWGTEGWDLVKFGNMELPVDAKVHVFGNENIRFELNEGRIRKVGDDRALKILEQLAPDKEIIILDPAKANALKKDFFESTRRNYLRTVESGAHCGAYSLMVVLTKAHLAFNPWQLLSPRVVDSQFGSSAEALIKEAQCHGLSGTALTGMTSRSLRNCKFPAMLLLDKSRLQERTKHWVVVLETTNDSFVIVDAPTGPEEIPIPIIESLWSGDAIIFGGDTALNSWQLSDVPGHSLPIMLAFLSLLFLLAASSKFNVQTEQGFQKAPKVANKFGLVLQILFIVLASVPPAILFYLNRGLPTNPEAVGLVLERLNRFEILEEIRVCTAIELRDLLQTKSVQVVDARLPSTTALGAIPDATFLPVDASLGELKVALASLERQKPIVVYCQNLKCEWDQTVATRLLRMGFRNVRVLEIGFDEWQRL